MAFGSSLRFKVNAKYFTIFLRCNVAIEALKLTTATQPANVQWPFNRVGILKKQWRPRVCMLPSQAGGQDSAVRRPRLVDKYRPTRRPANRCQTLLDRSQRS